MTSENRTLRRIRQRLEFQPWRGYFSIPNTDPAEEYNPLHFCESWDKCCSKNLLIKPTILLNIEKDTTSKLHKNKVKWIEEKMKSQKEEIFNNLKDNYEKKHEIETIVSRLKTYIWFANEIVRIKKFKEEPLRKKN